MADHALATVSNPDSSLTDFTLIVDLSDMPASWWSAVNTSDGTRGRVYKGDGTTRLACDWIAFDDDAETGFLRVLWSGTLSSTGTQELWIEPPVSGNAAVAADDTYGSDNAYDEYWEGYWPLEESDSPAYDRTSNGLDFDDGYDGGPTYGVTGQVGSCVTMPSTAGYYLDAGAYTPPEEITISQWVRLGADEDGWTFNNHNGTGGYGWITQARSNFEFRISTDGDDWNGGSGSSAISQDDTWYLVQCTFDGSTMRMYVDGTEHTDGDFPVTVSGTINDPGADLLVGQYASDFAGELDELQLHSTARSDDWLAEEYDQTSDNSAFWGTWSWETDGGGTTYSVSVSDGVALSDSPSTALTIPVSLADGMELADSPTGNLIISVSAADGVGLGDSVGGSATLPVSVLDGITLSDLPTAAFTFRVQTSDGIELSDWSSTGGAISVSVADGIILSDTVTAVKRIIETIADGAVFADSSSLSMTIAATVADGVRLSDVAAVAMKILVTVEDGITLSDVAVETSSLPSGEVSITISGRSARITFSGRRPDVDITGRAPDIDFS